MGKGGDGKVLQTWKGTSYGSNGGGGQNEAKGSGAQQEGKGASKNWGMIA